MINMEIGSHYFDVKYLDKVLTTALQHQASDIILESSDYLYFDIHGETFPVSERRLKRHEVQGIVKSLYQENGLAPLTRGRYLQFSYNLLHEDDTQTRFRVTVTGVMDDMDKNGVEIIFRPFPELAPSPEQLGLPKPFIQACHSNFGLIIVCGPTGSGKSTTLASILSASAQQNRERIISFEDPIEFDLRKVPNRLAKVSQSEVPTHLESFEQATENALRRTPKKILIGETRTAIQAEKLAIAALTGHLVLTTLHTNSAELAIPRLVDLFPQDSQHRAATRLLDSIRGIFHQRLVKNIDLSGRTAIWSYITFNEKSRQTLLVKFTQGQSLSSLMNHMIQKNGYPLLEDLKLKFSEGKVNINDYISLVSEIGQPRDLSLIANTAKKLHKSGKLNQAQHQEWMALYKNEIN